MRVPEEQQYQAEVVVPKWAVGAAAAGRHSQQACIVPLK